MLIVFLLDLGSRFRYLLMKSFGAGAEVFTYGASDLF
jgi:hypothetical protein